LVRNVMALHVREIRHGGRAAMQRVVTFRPRSDYISVSLRMLLHHKL
jgi:hypothetical protein